MASSAGQLAARGTLHGPDHRGLRRGSGSGEPGDEPNDIDVLVLVAGSADPNTTTRLARSAADEATERLGRDVTISVLTPVEWGSRASGFVRGVRQAALVSIDLRRSS